MTGYVANRTGYTSFFYLCILAQILKDVVEHKN